MYYETPLCNFTSISTISSNFGTIRPLVTENMSGQNLGGKKKKKKKKNKKKKKTKKKRSKDNIPTLFGRLNKYEKFDINIPKRFKSYGYLNQLTTTGSNDAQQTFVHQKRLLYNNVSLDALTIRQY